MAYNSLPSDIQIEKTIASVKSRNIHSEIVPTRQDALKEIKSMIPPGASIMTGASVTLQQIGFEDLLISKNHPWNNIKDALLAEKDPAKQAAIRKQGTMADYFLGSVHAVSETGEIIIASASGSQLPAYAFSSSNIIWVVGAQKIVPSLEEAFKRVREYVLPLEDQHMKQLHGPDSGSFIGKLMIFEREAPYLNRKLTLILVNEILGF